MLAAVRALVTPAIVFAVSVVNASGYVNIPPELQEVILENVDLVLVGVSGLWLGLKTVQASRDRGES